MRNLITIFHMKWQLTTIEEKLTVGKCNLNAKWDYLRNVALLKCAPGLHFLISFLLWQIPAFPGFCWHSSVKFEFNRVARAIIIKQDSVNLVHYFEMRWLSFLSINALGKGRNQYCYVTSAMSRHLGNQLYHNWIRTQKAGIAHTISKPLLCTYPNYERL